MGSGYTYCVCILSMNDPSRVASPVAGWQPTSHDPRLMQAMLQHAAAVPDANPQPTKRGR